MLSLPDGLLVQCPQVGSGETFIKKMILDRAANELGVKDRHQSDVECRLPLGESVKRGLAVALSLFLEQRELGPVADGQIARAWVSEGAAYSSFFFG
jgi:hypothetical protein